jgi:hypothetical protein
MITLSGFVSYWTNPLFMQVSGKKKTVSFIKFAMYNLKHIDFSILKN